MIKSEATPGKYNTHTIMYPSDIIFSLKRQEVKLPNRPYARKYCTLKCQLNFVLLEYKFAISKLDIKYQNIISNAK